MGRHQSVHGRLGVVFFFQAEDGIRDLTVTGVQTCALPIWISGVRPIDWRIVSCMAEPPWRGVAPATGRSEEHTSELQSQSNLVCRLLLEKKKIPRAPSRVARPTSSCHPALRCPGRGSRLSG